MTMVAASTHGILHGMVRTTISLPEALKRALERLAAERAISEACLVPEALAEKIARSARPRPRVPLFAEGLGDPTVADLVDELLEGRGR
jgi:hypothetical protein